MTTSKSLSLNKNKLGLSNIPKSLSTTVIGDNATQDDGETPGNDNGEQMETGPEEEEQGEEEEEEETEAPAGDLNSGKSSAREEEAEAEQG